MTQALQNGRGRKKHLRTTKNPGTSLEQMRKLQSESRQDVLRQVREKLHSQGLPFFSKRTGNTQQSHYNLARPEVLLSKEDPLRNSIKTELEHVKTIQVNQDSQDLNADRFHQRAMQLMGLDQTEESTFRVEPTFEALDNKFTSLKKSYERKGDVSKREDLPDFVTAKHSASKFYLKQLDEQSQRDKPSEIVSAIKNLRQQMQEKLTLMAEQKTSPNSDQKRLNVTSPIDYKAHIIEEEG